MPPSGVSVRLKNQGSFYRLGAKRRVEKECEKSSAIDSQRANRKITLLTSSQNKIGRQKKNFKKVTAN